MRQPGRWQREHKAASTPTLGSATVAAPGHHQRASLQALRRRKRGHAGEVQRDGALRWQLHLRLTCVFRSCLPKAGLPRGKGQETHRVMCPVVMRRLSRRSTSAAALLKTPGARQGRSVSEVLACGGHSPQRRAESAGAAQVSPSAMGQASHTQCGPRDTVPRASERGRCLAVGTHRRARARSRPPRGRRRPVACARVTACWSRCANAVCEGPACVHVALPGRRKEGTRGKPGKEHPTARAGRPNGAGARRRVARPRFHNWHAPGPVPARWARRQATGEWAKARHQTVALPCRRTGRCGRPAPQTGCPQPGCAGVRASYGG